MKLTDAQIQSITQGALDVIESDGYFRFQRFNSPGM